MGRDARKVAGLIVYTKTLKRWKNYGVQECCVAPQKFYNCDDYSYQMPSKEHIYISGRS